MIFPMVPRGTISPLLSFPEERGSRLAAVCFGSLAQRSPVSRISILAFLDSLGKDVLKIFDANLRGTFYDRGTLEASLRRCNILKINESELSVLVEYGLCSETDSCRNLDVGVCSALSYPYLRSRRQLCILYHSRESGCPGELRAGRRCPGCGYRWGRRLLYWGLRGVYPLRTHHRTGACVGVLR